jgi:hypothetical protein
MANFCTFLLSPVFEIRMFFDELCHYLTSFTITRAFVPISNLNVSFLELYNDMSYYSMLNHFKEFF